MLMHQLTHCVKTIVQGVSESPARQWRWVSLCIMALSILPIPAYSQSTGQCDDGSLRNLEGYIHQHWTNYRRADQKFTDIWYYQGELPKEQINRKLSLEMIVGYLNELGKRKSAVLFYQFNFEGKLSTWLFTSRGRKVCVQKRALTPDDWNILDARNWSVLGARGARQARAKAVFEAALKQDAEIQRPQWGTLLERLSKILLPTEVVTELSTLDIDTLVIVPITVVRENLKDPQRILHHPQGRPTLSLSTVPFAALPFENAQLIDKFSIVISPGFHSFARNPKQARKQFRDSIVLGNPISPPYPNLPGAEDEANRVAERLGGQVFIRGSATKTALVTYLNEHSASIDLIHLATHGVADAENPLDESVLVFSDGLWKARDIGNKLRLTSEPLVVMSACQTALGKDFPSGTVGLAQAWQRAGASNVVMSLWSVDDTATKELMGRFMDLVASGKAVDKALQAAMVSLRKENPNPAHWASFSIYGAPERIEETASP